MSAPPRLAPYTRPDRLALPRRAALAAEILVTYARVSRALRRQGDVRAAVAAIRGRPGGDSGGAAGYTAGVRLGKAAAQVLGPLPLDSGCLRLSLVLCALLARRGLASSVVIGVKGGSEFGAHAWVELDGRALLPASETDFERLVAL